MSSTDTLPIYKVAYDTLLLVMRVTGAFPRAYRYTLGQSLKEEALSLVHAIYHANGQRDKRHAIDSVIAKSHRLQVSLRACHDLRILPRKHYAQLSELSVSLSKQAYGWRKASPQRLPEQRDTLL